MPLALAASAAAARSPSQLGCSRASGISSSPFCSIGSSIARRRGVAEAKKKNKNKTRRLAMSSSSIKPSPLHASSRLARLQVAPFASRMESAHLYLGVDMGTSGGRAMVIDDFGTVVASAKKAYAPLSSSSSSPDAPPPPRDWAETWARALDDLLEDLSSDPSVLPRVASAAVAGTSASMLLVDAGGEEGEGGGDEKDEKGDKGSIVGAPLAPVRLYCDASSAAAVEATTALAPPGHQAAAPTSALSKLMDWWVSGVIEEKSGSKERGESIPVVVSAADWLTARLGCVGPKSSSSSTSSSSSHASNPWSKSKSSTDGQFLRSRLFVTDDNNQLKAGWDPGAREYEPWLRGHPAAAHLAPRVLRPGDDTGCRVAGAAVVENSGGNTTTYLPAGCLLAGGTTDSIAATLAAGVRSTPGDAVTSLGSSLAIKLVSGQRIDDGRRGIYSHLIPGDGEEQSVWLVGGSSNAGCAVFRSEFGPDDSVLERLTAEIETEGESPSSSSPTSGLNYYPLPRKGERFPVCDPEKEPILGPRPGSDALHLKAILEGITAIEAAGFAALEELGAPKPVRVLTAGGGAKNAVWTRMRARALSPAVVTAAEEGEAAYGAALLARRAVTGKW